MPMREATDPPKAGIRPRAPAESLPAFRWSGGRPQATLAQTAYSMPYQPPTAQRRPRIDQADFGWAEAVAELSHSLKHEHARASARRESPSVPLEKSPARREPLSCRELADSLDRGLAALPMSLDGSSPSRATSSFAACLGALRRGVTP